MLHLVTCWCVLCCHSASEKDCARVDIYVRHLHHVLFFPGIIVGVIYSGGYLLASGDIKPGQLMSFLVASQTIQRSLTSISILFGQAIRGTSAGARVFEVWESNDPVTQATITRTKMRTLIMHTLDFLNKRGHILLGALQPIECVLFALLSLLFSLSLQCDMACRPFPPLFKGAV